MAAQVRREFNRRHAATRWLPPVFRKASG
jgi:hypothetical protein